MRADARDRFAPAPQDRRNDTLLVITGLAPVIPIQMALRFSKRDGRHKAGHDRESVIPGEPQAREGDRVKDRALFPPPCGQGYRI